MKKILEYCKAHIEDWDVLEAFALRGIDHMRCPLSMACPELYYEMESAIADYCEDNELNPDDYDVEEVFWAD